MENERTQFTFYKSFYDALSMLRKATDRAMAYDAICRFALFGVEPDREKMPETVAMAMLLILPTLTSGRRKALSGQTGGRKHTESKPEANGKQSESSAEASKKQNASKKEEEGEREIENESSPPYPPQGEAAAPPSRKNFVPPTVEEVAAYCRQRGNGIDPETFVAFYSAKGWMIGKNKMKDWKQAVITWEKGDRRRKGDADHGCDAADGASASKWDIVYSG